MTFRRAIALTILLSGCGFFSRSKSRFYSLDTIPGTARASVTGAPIAINTVELPPGLDRREVVVRKENHELDIRGTDQWQASMEPMLLHTLAFDLASRLPEGMMILPGQLVGGPPANGIDVIVEELAAGPQNAITFNVRWVQAGVTHREEINVPIASLESAEIAAGTSTAIATLADRIVASLRSAAVPGG